MPHSLATAPYELAARALFAPFGGLDGLRARVIETVPAREGARVLEVGCGPGALTAALLARGARVHAVDASPAMLRAAREAAPAATFEQADARTYTPAARFDAVLLSFLLHELPAAERAPLVARLASALSPGGVLVVVDHAAPPAAAGRTWRFVLRLVESPTVHEWLAFDVAALLAAPALAVVRDEALAGGRARLVVAQRPG
jgi:trans-aconitate methyltransferase